jgi:hypothetical protein
MDLQQEFAAALKPLLFPRSFTMNQVPNDVATPTLPPVAVAIDPRLVLGMIVNFAVHRELSLTLHLPLPAAGTVDSLVSTYNDALADKVRETEEYKAVADLQTKERSLGEQLSVVKARLETAKAKKNELVVTTPAVDLPAALAESNKATNDLSQQVAETESALVALREARAIANPALARRIVQSGQAAAGERATAAIERRDAALATAATKIANDIGEAALQESFWRFAMSPLITQALARKLGCDNLVSGDGRVASHLETAPTPPATVLKSADPYSDWNRIMGAGKTPPPPPGPPKAGDVIGKIEWARG